MNRLHPRMQVPAVLLAASGGLQLISVGLTLMWFVLGLLSSAVQLIDMRNEPEVLGIMLGVSVWQGLTRTPQVVLAISGAITARGALHAFTGGRRSVIRIGAIASVVGPLVALLGGLCLVLSFDCMGFFFGGIGRFLMLVIGVVTWTTLQSALQFEEVAEGYEADDEVFAD
ncbi:MAG: hypothetical protein EP330_01315 [Deltaproteobacteria bacterium]|nr:MAG: hypothetical protein EP330_01315 [Deltaproteobacteria bacterium]